MATVAKTDRDQRELEIKDKVETLKAQRVLLAAEVPADILKDYERVFEQRGEDAVAFIEMQSRKDMDFTCGGCMMHIPADTINGLLATGRITRCSSCRCYLYVTDELTKTLSEPMKGRKKADAL
jgi:predicted  nucleic acid-binding Zn-ribbon protein